MTTVKTTLYIHNRIVPAQYVWEDEIEIRTFDMTDMEHYRGEFVLIGTHDVEVPIPDVDVTAQAIDALERKADDVMAEARARVAELHERIAKLRCLEHLGEVGE